MESRRDPNNNSPDCFRKTEPLPTLLFHKHALMRSLFPVRAERGPVTRDVNGHLVLLRRRSTEVISKATPFSPSTNQCLRWLGRGVPVKIMAGTRGAGCQPNQSQEHDRNQRRGTGA